jgi:hypothetical protein
MAVENFQLTDFTFRIPDKNYKALDTANRHVNENNIANAGRIMGRNSSQLLIIKQIRLA